ncbi:MAG TPA: low-specificity L-threonine aldolase [Oculatellaceae cyanobacterium]
MKRVDLRSDTVTHPTKTMRDAMYAAEVGDDVFGDDPTVNRLEEIAAERVGKEAGLFVPSGSMGNLVSVLTHCQRGDEIILGDRSHIFMSEQGNTAALGGVHARPLRNAANGQLDLDEIDAAVNDDDVHRARTRLISLENTFNGRVLRPEYLDAVANIAAKHKLKMHLDGARIFNAAVALNTPVKTLTKHFDSVQFCFSKGLSCPVGSIICSDREFIKQARRNRKLVGGAMRQVGVLAAACIVALDEMVERLAEDHATAKQLAEGLANFSELEINAADIETNILFFHVKKAGLGARDLTEKLKESGVLMLPFGPNSVRAVTHYGITKEDINYTLDSFRAVLGHKTAAAR